MKNNMNRTILQVVTDMKKNCKEVAFAYNKKCIPNKEIVITIIKRLQNVMFPGYFELEFHQSQVSDCFIENQLFEINEMLQTQIEAAITYKNNMDSKEEIDKAVKRANVYFFEQLPRIQKLLIQDVHALYNGDPAAKSKEEIIFSYPGLFATYVYRIAHELYVMNIPFIPRIMSEYAHSKTSIDIHAGADIGAYFFIDHGTGLVIGETTYIGDHVKIYQGVTLGAISTRSGQSLSNIKRHPTIMDYVTIYSGATILGGNTVIGEGSVIGGNAFITDSVPPQTQVSVKNLELTFKQTFNHKKMIKA